jgi:hypothetical protein
LTDEIPVAKVTPQEKSQIKEDVNTTIEAKLKSSEAIEQSKQITVTQHS